MFVRYLIAMIVAGVVIALALGYVFRVRAELYDGLREQLRQSKADGTLPPELANVDIETMPLSDFGIELSSSMKRKVTIADFILGAWIVWIPLLILLCLGAAYILPRRTSPDITHSATAGRS